jgi:hypothetical protein
MLTKIHRLKKTRACCGLRVAGLRGRALKNCDKKTTPKFFTSQLETRNSQPSPPRSKKLAVDFGFSLISLIRFFKFSRLISMINNIPYILQRQLVEIHVLHACFLYQVRP